MIRDGLIYLACLLLTGAALRGEVAMLSDVGDRAGAVVGSVVLAVLE